MDKPGAICRLRTSVLCSILHIRSSSSTSGRCIGFLNDLFYGRSYIVAPAELSIPVLLDEKSTVVPVRLAGEQSGGKRKVSYGDARSNSERAAPSACVGKRFSAVRLSGIDRLDAPGRGSAGPDD